MGGEGEIKERERGFLVAKRACDGIVFKYCTWFSRGNVIDSGRCRRKIPMKR